MSHVYDESSNWWTKYGLSALFVGGTFWGAYELIGAIPGFQGEEGNWERLTGAITIAGLANATYHRGSNMLFADQPNENGEYDSGNTILRAIGNGSTDVLITSLLGGATILGTTLLTDVNTLDDLALSVTIGTGLSGSLTALRYRLKPHTDKLLEE